MHGRDIFSVSVSKRNNGLELTLQAFNYKKSQFVGSIRYTQVK